MNLTPHFTLEELIHSDTAKAKGIDNKPTRTEIANLMRLAQTLEEVRNVLGGKTIIISSGYRGEELNKAVGGVNDSAHRHGLAADFICPAWLSVRDLQGYLGIGRDVRPTHLRNRPAKPLGSFGAAGRQSAP